MVKHRYVELGAVRCCLVHSRKVRLQLPGRSCSNRKLCVMFTQIKGIIYLTPVQLVRSSDALFG